MDLITKGKHMNLDDRIEIQNCLNQGMSFKAIAKRISKDQTTVSKEVKNHILVAPSDIKRTDATGKFITTPCPSLIKPPFVCNPCKKRRGVCSFQKQLYIAKIAQKEYEELLVSCREGIPLNKEQFYTNDRIISNCIKQGQHLYHALQTNNLKVSKSTVYRHLHKGYLSISAIEMPRVVKFKPRKTRKDEYIPRAIKLERTYQCFLEFTQNKGISSWVEMDTVIGLIGGKAILTLDFTFCNFMVGILLDNKTSAEVTEKILLLKAKLNKENLKFGDVFPVILTDNGGEFSNVFAIENAIDEEKTKETALFFCDPFMSSQKPRVEKNHTLFRDIVPKGTSFDTFSQETVNLIFSHVNSVKRKIYNSKTPYEVFSFTYGEEITDILGICEIAASKVRQSPALLKDLK